MTEIHEMPGMMLYFDRIGDTVEYLDNESLGKFFRALYTYGRFGREETDELPREVTLVWKYIKSMLDDSRQKYAETCIKNSYNAQKGYAKARGEEMPPYEEYKEQYMKEHDDGTSPDTVDEASTTEEMAFEDLKSEKIRMLEKHIANNSK